MIAPALPPAALEAGAAAPALVLEGRTAEGRRVVLELGSGAVRAVRVGVLRYGCGRFGDVGPVVVSVTGRAPVGRDGRFHLRAGRAVQRLALDGRLGRDGRTVAGSLRLTGTIATGALCRSRRVAFRATARRPAPARGGGRAGRGVAARSTGAAPGEGPGERRCDGGVPPSRR